MSSLLLIIVGGVLVNNFVMSQFLGICPFLGVSKKTETALGMGMAVTFVMAIASLFTFFIQRYLLIPLELEYMQTIAFILVIAVLVQTVEMVLKRSAPLPGAGRILPLITTTCAVWAWLSTTPPPWKAATTSSSRWSTARPARWALRGDRRLRGHPRAPRHQQPAQVDGRLSGALIAAGVMSIGFRDSPE
jgi:hypothetical protein